MTPAHGTRARYNTPHGCRCEPCRTAGRRYRKSRFLALAQGTTRLVDAGPVKLHLIAAQQAGISVKAVAKAAGVSQTVAQDVRHGRHARIERRSAEAILAVDPARLRPMQGSRVLALGTVRRVRALAVLGWSGRAMAEQMGISHSAVSRALAGGYEVNSITRQRVAKGYRRLILIGPPQATPSERIASRKARERARVSGWAGPLDWEDIDNDEAPIPSEPYKPATVPQQARDLEDMGLNDEQIGLRLGIKPSTVREYLTRRAAA
jgi:transcriptional regulator with XRE-family HTH domain